MVIISRFSLASKRLTGVAYIKNKVLLQLF